MKNILRHIWRAFKDTFDPLDNQRYTAKKQFSKKQIVNTPFGDYTDNKLRNKGSKLI